MIRGCGALPGLRRGRPEFSVSRSSAAASRAALVNASPPVHSESHGTRRPRRAMQPRGDAFGRRFVPTRPTGVGHLRPPFARPSGWLDYRYPPRTTRAVEPSLQPAAIGARDASLFSAYFLEAPGSGRTSRTVIRGAASLASSPRAARGYAHSCRHSTPHPNCATRLLADRVRPRPPCVTRRDTSSSYARCRRESIRFEPSPSFLAYRTVGGLFPRGGFRKYVRCARTCQKSRSGSAKGSSLLTLGSQAVRNPWCPPRPW